ncbi:hypothetical protein H5410_022455 [Solanum commersonii]|uniref:RNase H type-1 domain-containing protein n=1 Tax=Solanum commersonii TaxID=4109 RepID=A0A9J5ZJB4_SOLCO|nr:hypothetical protein H5410_022455 [Solanum commersonii]
MVVRWSHPPMGVYKCNTDASYQLESGVGCIAFCIRDIRGDFKYAKSRRINTTFILEAEVMAIKEGLTGGSESYTWSMGGPMTDSLGYQTHSDNDKESWDGGTERQQYQNMQELPQQAKAILQQDKEKTSNLRIRKVQNKHYNGA